MNKKNILIISAVSFIFILGTGAYLYKKSSDDPKYNGLTAQQKAIVGRIESKEKLYYDEIYYHRDQKCVNRKGLMSMYNYSKVTLLADGKKPCPVCIPEEQGGK